MQSWKWCAWFLDAVMLPVLLAFACQAAADDEPLKCIAYRHVLSIDDQLRLPSDVAVDGQDRIYILDGTAGLIRVYDQQGRPLFTLGGDRILNQPLGLDVTAEGDVLVADSGNHRLVLFPSGGRPPRFLPIPSLPGGKPADPTDVAFAAEEGVFHAVDNESHRIVTLDRNGKILWSKGIMGRNPEEFRFPFMIDLDSAGNLYVVEVINTRVQVMRPDGTHIRFIGDWGIEPGQFFRPKGVAVTDNNEIFVTDSYLGVIQAFFQDGEFLGVICDHTGHLIQFTTPVGITFSHGRLLVVEMIENRLVILEEIPE